MPPVCARFAWIPKCPPEPDVMSIRYMSGMGGRSNDTCATNRPPSGNSRHELKGLEDGRGNLVFAKASSFGPTFSDKGGQHHVWGIDRFEVCKDKRAVLSRQCK